MLGDNVGSNSADYFFINSANGDIFLRRSLTEAPLNQYSVSKLQLNLIDSKSIRSGSRL